jgi:hypothetical protein
LIQIDGSDHRWFEDRGDRCTLLVFIDDATSKLMQLRFGGAPLTCERICTPLLEITATARTRVRMRIVYPRSTLGLKATPAQQSFFTLV